jgi:hypothetical protein
MESWKLDCAWALQRKTLHSLPVDSRGNPKGKVWNSDHGQARRRHGSFMKGVSPALRRDFSPRTCGAGSGPALEVIGVAGGSVDGQDAHATGATAGAAEVAGIAGWCLHNDVETCGSGDHGGANVDRELRTAFHSAL